MRRETKPCPFYGMPCEYVPMAEKSDAQAAEIERLRAALLEIAEGSIPRPVAKPYRTDGTPSKNDQCEHGQWMYEECGQCIEQFARAALEGRT